MWRSHQIYPGAVLERSRVGGVIDEADHVTVCLGGVKAVSSGEDVRVQHDEILLLAVHQHAVD